MPDKKNMESDTGILGKPVYVEIVLRISICICISYNSFMLKWHRYLKSILTVVTDLFILYDVSAVIADDMALQEAASKNPLSYLVINIAVCACRSKSS